MTRPSVTLSILSTLDGREFTFTQDTIKIGKLKSSDVYLDDPGVSRIHAVIEAHEGGYRILDLGSLKGVYVNEARVTRYPLKTGDIVQVGNTRMSVFLESTGATPSEPIPPEAKTPGYHHTPSWAAFADSGMLWWVNRVLHPFGWVLVFEWVGPEASGEPAKVYPARTTCRGFTPEVDDAGFAKFDASLEKDFRSR